jgi:galactonate dehydratase
VIALQIVAVIIRDIMTPLLQGRDPHDVMAINKDIYQAMRVRGFFGGFYADALASVNIALWDLRGKLTGLPVCKLLGAQYQRRVPAYVSGLPKAIRSEKHLGAFSSSYWLGASLGPFPECRCQAKLRFSF